MNLKEQDKHILSYYRKSVKYLPKGIRKQLPEEISVVSVSEKESAALNRRYCKKNKAANVLSFRYSKKYGEILVCPAVIRREAREAGNTVEYQMTWYILHGMIHLSGLHHEESISAEKKFSRIERAILAKIFNGAPRHHHRT